MTLANTKKLVISALLMAVAFVLPFLTGQLQQLGSMLAPMHIPVLLCGFICGPLWGLGMGALSPILRSLIFGMPPLMPIAVAMAFELATYGFVAGLMYKLTARKPISIYVSLIVAMLLGRCAWGIAMSVLVGGFGLQAFLAGAFVNAWPGIVLHIVLIPVLVLALEKEKLIPIEG